MRKVALLLLSCFSWIGMGQAQVESDPSVRHELIRAQLTPQHYTILGSEMNAIISRITAKEGERFQAGQTLVELDCGMQRAQLKRAQAALSAANHTYQANQTLLSLHSVGQLELDLSSDEVAKAKADVSLMETTLQKCAIQAPFSGRVVEQKARAAQYVQAGQAILDILDDSQLELEFIVPSQWLTWLKKDYPFHVVIDETQQSYPAKIMRLGARVDPISQSIKMMGAIEGQYPELMAGMSGRIEMLPPTEQTHTNYNPNSLPPRSLT